MAEAKEAAAGSAESTVAAAAAAAAAAAPAACRLCGGAIETRRTGGAVYCEPCRARVSKESRSTAAECAECGTSFQATNRSVRYCSDECREKGYRRRGQGSRRPLPPHDGTAACRICGTTFEAPSRTIKYCSDECRKKGYMRGRRGPGRPVGRTRGKKAECRSCGKEFKVDGRAGTPRAYCSDECRTEGRRARSREYLRRYLADPEKRALHVVRGTEAAARRRAAARAKK